MEAKEWPVNFTNEPFVPELFDSKMTRDREILPLVAKSHTTIYLGENKV